MFSVEFQLKRERTGLKETRRLDVRSHSECTGDGAHRCLSGRTRNRRRRSTTKVVRLVGHLRTVVVV